MFSITRKTLFYYDKKDILKPSRRSGIQNQKEYDNDKIKELQEVLLYKQAGFQLEEIKQIKKETELKKRQELIQKVEERIHQEIQERQEYLHHLKQLKR